ncbi:hypothetical protein F5Y01DRAFT_276676 [Xylaria sp. FL0043]|nr:hypothetical protein F5Y01DRAFT_276676 [Xylaria sp. FL0043]
MDGWTDEWTAIGGYVAGASASNLMYLQVCPSHHHHHHMYLIYWMILVISHIYALGTDGEMLFITNGDTDKVGLRRLLLRPSLATYLLCTYIPSTRNTVTYTLRGTRMWQSRHRVDDLLASALSGDTHNNC